MATIVLVPGFWLGAWAWDEVAAGLRAAGHDVHPVTLTGLAERAAEATPKVNVDTHIADLVDLIEGGDLSEVVLVGHSGANMPVTGAADRLAARVRRVVYVDAGPLPSGMAQLDFSEPAEQQAVRAQVESAGDGWLIPVPPFDPAGDAAELAGLTAEHLAMMRERGTPQPFGTAAQPLLRPESPPAIPASVIATTFSPEQALALAGTGIPVFAAMAAMDLHHLPTGHWPMFSRPADLAALLDLIAAG